MQKFAEIQVKRLRNHWNDRKLKNVLSFSLSFIFFTIFYKLCKEHHEKFRYEQRSQSSVIKASGKILPNSRACLIHIFRFGKLIEGSFSSFMRMFRPFHALSASAGRRLIPLLIIYNICCAMKMLEGNVDFREDYAPACWYLQSALGTKWRRTCTSSQRALDTVSHIEE